jgi:hypothetical protein
MIGACVGALGLFASLFIRSVPRRSKEKTAASDL